MPKIIDSSEAMKLFRKLKTDQEMANLVKVLYEKGYEIEKNSLNHLAGFMEQREFHLCAGRLFDKSKNPNKAIENYAKVGDYNSAVECAERAGDYKTAEEYRKLEALVTS